MQEDVNCFIIVSPLGFPGGSDSKESACSAGDLGSIPGSERSTGEGNGNPHTPVFLPREFHEQRSLVGHTAHEITKSQTLLSD